MVRSEISLRPVTKRMSVFPSTRNKTFGKLIGHSPGLPFHEHSIDLHRLARVFSPRKSRGALYGRLTAILPGARLVYALAQQPGHGAAPVLYIADTTVGCRGICHFAQNRNIAGNHRTTAGHR